MAASRRALAVGILISMLLLVCTCSLIGGSAITREARKKAQEWWDTSVARCGNDLYTKIVLDNISVGEFETTDKPLIQFKPVRFELLDEPVTEADKLNGTEWKGFVAIPAKLTFRYYSDKGEWSSWREGTVTYGPDIIRDAVIGLAGKKVNRPLALELKKEKGNWNYDSTKNESRMNNLAKPDCAEIPND